MGVITYFQLNREYITEFLCINKEKPVMACHGQCFLQTNLNLADNAVPDKGAVPAPATQTIEFPVFLIAENKYSFETNLQAQPGNFRYLLHSCEGHTASQFRPPSPMS
jgi:hypothetical protein